jgi:tryptophanyl-tRNA synthetase
MFSRIYKPKNGKIKLYTPIANHKEAINWARLSTSDIAKELNDKSMEEIFINPKDVYDKLAVQPDWKPHTLAKQIENLVMPDTIKKQGRQKIVAMSYDQENTQGETQQRTTTNKVWNDRAKIREGTKDKPITPEETKEDTLTI